MFAEWIELGAYGLKLGIGTSEANGGIGYLICRENEGGVRGTDGEESKSMSSVG